jgi:hypothetical protein
MNVIGGAIKPREYLFRLAETQVNAHMSYGKPPSRVSSQQSHLYHFSRTTE